MTNTSSNNNHLLFLQKPFKKLLISCTDGIYFLPIPDIITCEADGNYTQLHLITGDRLTTCKSLKEIEAQLTDYGFYRVHQSHLVNLQYIRKYHRHGILEMTNDSLIRIAQRKKEAFLKYIQM